jgi:hypothetical protein
MFKEDKKSRMKREFHVRIRGSLEGKFLWATRSQKSHGKKEGKGIKPQDISLSMEELNKDGC